MLIFHVNSHQSGTHILVQERTEKNGWHLTIDKINGKALQCSIHPPSNALIGRYQCSIFLQTGNDTILDEEPDIVLICNPWNEDDEVFLKSEEKRKEYVLNDQGAIWVGTGSTIIIRL